jgi:hypothetical protein
MKKLLTLTNVLSVLLIMILWTPSAGAANSCTFTTAGTTMILDGDCWTDATILIPDGFMLDGAGHTITAVDPSGGHFLGAVVKNEGSTAHVKNLTVTASGLANVCDGSGPPDNRLRGILFDGASGSIMHNTVVNINQGASGCQEGNAIEVRNAPFDGTHPGTKTVEISHNKVDNYQKTGIVANGDVTVSIHHNLVGSSATQANLAANSVQLGYGANGSVKHNNVDGNQWLGASNYAASAILIVAADSGDVSENNVGGNSDVGIFVVSDNGTYDNNRAFDHGSDGPHGDFGIADLGMGNAFTNNKVRGFDYPYYGVSGGKNKVIPGPQTSS